jgi:hypothetical protein
MIKEKIMKAFLSAVAFACMPLSVPASAQVPYEFIDYGDSVSFAGPDGDFNIFTRESGPSCDAGHISWDDFRAYLDTLDGGRVILQTDECGQNIRACVGERMGSPEICYVGSWVPQ